ncbi:MAG: histidine kinase [Propionibacteriaceae bacterium]|jgi:signal transduction histidine kinase|nr:histidine kinase [Propionibacteriaceae bacterium]
MLEFQTPHSRVPTLVRHPRLVETATLAVALVSAAVGVINYLVVGAPAGLAGIGLGTAGVALVRRWPWPGVALAGLAPLAGALLGADPLVPWSIAVFVVLVAALRGLPALPAGGAVGVAAYLSVITADRAAWLYPLAVLSLAVAVAFAAIGASLRSTQQYWAEVQARADDALAVREAEVERKVAEERLRIAHDLHDTLGHEIALISMSVGAAEARLDTDLDAARADLVQAGERVQKALAETQRTLTVLRDPSESAPAAGYAQIGRLVGEFRESGLEVAASIAAEPGRLDPEAGAAAYRIVQEALVNARKHGAGIVRLQVAADRGSIRIEAVNRRAAAEAVAGAGGYGLIGMRERAASAGGRIDVDSDDVLFVLRATLPVAGRANR